MPINRYYAPSRGQYISQFVPNELPADAMLKGILLKQKQADDTSAAMSEIKAAYDPKALPEFDTNYVKGQKKKLTDFIESSYGQDLTSPEFKRRYREFMNEFKNDEGTKQVEAAYATHQAALAKKAKLAEKDHGLAEEFWDNYTRSYNIYTAKGGLGYTGQVLLEDPANIKTGVDTQKEIEELFNHVGADKFESLKKLSGADIYYSVTSGGKSADKLENAGLTQLPNFIRSHAGEQLRARFRQKNIPTTLDGQAVTQQQYLNSLTPAEREQFGIQEMEYVQNQVLSIGSTFVTEEYTSTIEGALNKQGDRDYEKMKDQVIIDNVLEGGYISTGDITWDEQLKVLGSKAKGLEEKLNDIKKNPSMYPEGALENTIKEIKNTETQALLVEQTKKEALQNAYSTSKKNNNFDNKVTSYGTELSRVLSTVDQDKLKKNNPQLYSLMARAAKDPSLLQKSSFVEQLKQHTTVKEDPNRTTSMEDWTTIKNGIKKLTPVVDKLSSLHEAVQTDTKNSLTHYYQSKKDMLQDGYTSVPTWKGSASDIEMRLIKSGQGYTFYDPETGKPLSKGAMSSIDLNSLSMSGLTNTGYSADPTGHRGRVLTGIVNTPIRDENGNLTGKTKPSSMKMVVVPQSTNTNALGDEAYAADYLEMHNKIGSTRPMEKERTRQLALSLYNPNMASAIDNIESSGKGTTGIMPITNPNYEGMSVQVEKLKDGSWSLRVYNTKYGNLNPIGEPTYYNNSNQVEQDLIQRFGSVQF